MIPSAHCASGPEEYARATDAFANVIEGICQNERAGPSFAGLSPIASISPDEVLRESKSHQDYTQRAGSVYDGESRVATPDRFYTINSAVDRAYESENERKIQRDYRVNDDDYRTRTE